MGVQRDIDGADAPAAKPGPGAFCCEIDAQLADAQYLCAEFTFADIAFYMAQLFGERLGAPLDGSTPKLLAWRARLSARPSVRAVVKPMMEFLAANGRPVPAFLAQL